MFCQQAFTGLGDLAGRRVRVSSVGQGELIEALGATPVVTPFAEIVQAVRDNVVQCAITGTLFRQRDRAACGDDACLPRRDQLGRLHLRRERARLGGAAGEDRAAIAGGLATLQEDIWRGAEQETEDGLRCNAGRPDCVRRHARADDDRRGPAAGPRPPPAIAHRLRAARLGAALRRRLRRDLERDHGRRPAASRPGRTDACRPAGFAWPSPLACGLVLLTIAGGTTLLLDRLQDTARTNAVAAGAARGAGGRKHGQPAFPVGRRDAGRAVAGARARSPGRGDRPRRGQPDAARPEFPEPQFPRHHHPARGWPALGQRPRRVPHPALAGRPRPARGGPEQRHRGDQRAGAQRR